MDPYATRDDLKGYLRIPTSGETDFFDTSTDDEDDALLDLCLAAATTAINRSTNRRFNVGSLAEERYFNAKWDPEILRVTVDIHDTFADAEDITVKYASLSDGEFDTTVTGGFRMWPYNAAIMERPFTRLVMNRSTTCPRGEVQVRAVYGWDATPDTITTACLLQASRYFKRRDAPFGVAGSPDLGNELRLLAKLDPDVAMMVGDFRRWWAA